LSRAAPERRSNPRIPADFELQGQPQEGGVTARMVASNLSLGGLYCTSRSDFPEMTKLAVRLLLPDKNGEPAPLDVEAVVVRRNEVHSATGNTSYELALFFTQMDESARESIASFLDS
jgi:hypothetical protein